MVDSGETPPYRRTDAATSERVEDLLERMTLAEKAGQLAGSWAGNFKTELDLEGLKAAIDEHHIGVAAPFGWAGAITMDASEAVEVANELQRFATEETRLGIPLLLNADAVHGNAYLAGSTVFPHGLGAAATWNPEGVERAARVTARELRCVGGHQNYAPTCDVGRDPRWGRVFETFGESPRLVADMAAAKVRGYQGDGLADEERVVATAKHFPAYGEPERGEDASPVDVSAYKLRNVFLPPFLSAFEAGVESVMPSYNSINGEPAHASSALLTDLLREELEFSGHVVTDWGAVKQLEEEHRTAADHREAVRQSREAGIDVASVDHVEHAEALVDLVEAGELAEARLDESVRRVLRVKFELGLFEDPFVDPDRAAATLATDEHREVALECARESMTLLENDGLLPLSDATEDGDPLSVFVGGPSADDVVHQMGGWSVDRPAAVPGTTIREALAERLGSERVTHEPGTTLNEERDLEAAVEKAAAADVAVLALGEGWYLHEFGPAVQAGTETGDWPTRSQLRLSDAQRELVRRVHETGTPVVGVLVTGRPLVVDWMAAHVPAILMAYYPGIEGGRAIVETLFGENDPSGRLPLTVPRSAGDLPQLADHLAHPRPIGLDEHPASYDPLYAFGHGLSYTDFGYGDVALETETIDPEGSLAVTVPVENVGERAGTETVQLYASQETSRRVRPTRWLVGFDRVTLEPGEREAVTISVPAERFGYYEPDGTHVLEAGAYAVHCGDGEVSFEVESGST